MMNLFLFLFIAALIAAVTWTILVLRSEPQNRRFPGLVGAWTTTLILAAMWQAEAVPWLWVFLKIVLMVWFAAMVFLIVATVSISQVKTSTRTPLLCCAFSSILINVSAGVLFLWHATVSGGGV